MSLFDLLDVALAAEDPTPLLRDVVRRPDLADVLPEVADLLLMDASARGRHKQTWDHSVKVAAKTDPADRELRWAALLHDIGKPATRRIAGGEVTFRHHEQVGERIVRDLLPRIGCTDGRFVDRVARAVGLSGRFKADGPGAAAVWTDSAVRRFVRDCGGPTGGDGSVLDLVLDLNFADVTSKHDWKVRRTEDDVQALTDRIRRVLAADARQAERPDLDGQQVMGLLGLTPGSEVGEALSALLAAKRAAGGPLPDPAGWLTDWWASRTDTDTAAA